ncbi:MAG: DUF3857 domain-containing protein [Alphaproteobacteria bacterium]|nr:DUF3857 domain-containing protein [Alphaproteobacteria bacterium]
MKKYVLVFFVFVFLSNFGHASDYQISPPPSWVDTVKNEGSQVDHDLKDYGISSLLHDIQEKVEKNSIISFQHRIYKILQQDIIQDISNIEIGFDPQHETVHLHQVCLKRGSKTFNQLFPHNIRVLQREKQLENNIYTGEKSLVIFLEDIRVGDILEYIYSIENSDCRLVKNFYSQMPLTKSIPIAHMRYRLVWPRDRALSIKNHGTQIKPTTKDLINIKEYIWNIKNAKATHQEEDTPPWHYPYPRVEVGAKKSWQEIASEKAEVFKVPDQLSNELKSHIAQISRKHKNPSDQLLAVVQFIQDEIRYMSIPMDDGLPTDPSIVFKRRYGDCRDKSLLALTILKGLGIKALPVLAHTQDGKILNKILPHTAFNHAIILAHVNGKPYYFDLTLSFQRGNLENFSPPNYGYALVLDPTTTALTDMTSPLSNLSFRAYYETFDLSKGFDAPALLSVKTFVKGKSADFMREFLASKDIENHQKAYFDYYKDFYPSIALKDNLKITDDTEKNEITVLESYEIQNPGVVDSSKANLVFSHHANELRSYFTETINLPRTMPISVYYPLHFLKHITVLLPGEENNITPEKIEVKDPSFHFSKMEQIKENRFSISYHYMALADHVIPENAPAHIENIKQVKDALGRNLTTSIDNNVKDSINWPVLILTLIITLIFSYVCFKIYFYKPKKVMESPSSTQYQGIRGWLILPAIGLIISPFYEAYALKEYFTMIHSHNAWSMLLDTSLEDYNPLKAPYLLSLLFIVIAEAVYCVLLLFLFFKKKQIFPIAFMVWLWASPSVAFILEVLNVYIIYEPLGGLYKAGVEYLRSIVSAIIWTAYFMRSKRVKATFIQA